MSLEDLWPLFGLRVQTERLELRPPSDADVAALARLAAAGVHPPEVMPFSTPWTDQPPGELERGVLRWHWRSRAEWTPASWHLDFAVVADGDLVGAQGLSAADFSVKRTVETGSWLSQAHQGRGIGKQMRTAVLALAFDGLAALEAHSGAYTDNLQSTAVSRALGYRDNGYVVEVRRGQRAIQRRYVMTLADWRARPRARVDISGLERCLPLFGADPRR